MSTKLKVIVPKLIVFLLANYDFLHFFDILRTSFGRNGWAVFDWKGLPPAGALEELPPMLKPPALGAVVAPPAKAKAGAAVDCAGAPPNIGAVVAGAPN